MEKKNNAVVKKVIIAVVVAILLIAAIFLTKSFIDNKNEPSNGDVPSSSQTQTTEPIEKPDYSEYVEQNPETVGWITIPGTTINFPVVHSIRHPLFASFKKTLSLPVVAFVDTTKNDNVKINKNNIIIFFI